MSLQSGTVSVGGTQLYYEQRGTGEAVLLLHGLTLDTRMWNAQFEALSTAYRVIRFDMRGHGRSRGADAPFSQSDDVRGLLDSLKVDRAHIVGFSMGGYVAYEFALDHPDRILSLSLVNSAWRFDPTRTSAVQTRIVGYLTTCATDLEAGLRQWASDPLFAAARRLPALWKEIEQIIVGGHGAQGPGAYLCNPVNPIPPSPLAELRLSALTTNTLVVIGELDDPEFVAHAETLSKTIAGARLVTITGAGHMSPMEMPEQVTRALVEFLGA